MWFDLAALDDVGTSYANSLGKALALAQAFEEDCKYVLTIANLSIEADSGRISSLADVSSYSERLAASFKLGRDVVQFRARHSQSSEDVATLVRGAQARNYIAHEAAHPLLHGKSARKAIQDNLPHYEKEVVALADAAHKISCWSFEIQEHSAPPPRFARSYSEDAAAWVLYEVRNIRDGV